jgi:hypothetical protein
MKLQYRDVIFMTTISFFIMKKILENLSGETILFLVIVLPSFLGLGIAMPLALQCTVYDCPAIINNLISPKK